MKELVDKYKDWHKDTPEKWKSAMIDIMRKDSGVYINLYQDIDWLYDDAIDYLFYKSTVRVRNLAKKMNYEEIPCLHCKNIIKYWGKTKEVGWIWSPDKDYLFKSKL